MTVVAWDTKTLSADSMETDDHGFHMGNCTKLYRLKSGGILGECGMSDNRAIISLLDSVKDEVDLPSRAELEATRSNGTYLLILPDKKAYHINVEEIDDFARFVASISPLKGSFAIGHGGDFARAAMALGKTSQDAVRLACRFSAFCQLPVQTIRLEDKPKEKIKRVRKPNQSEAVVE